jgi:hypothetical protein
MCLAVAKPNKLSMQKNLLKFFVSVAVLILSISACAQNLIKNPGFETDKNNWNGFWSKEGTGTANFVPSPVHSGNKAIKIEYPGSQDWAFTSTDKLQVNAGATYDLSCWTMISAVTSEINFSVVLYDAKYNVVNWAFSRIKMTQNSSIYTQYSTTFFVPEGIKYIQPRFEGWGSCTLFADDVSLSPSNSSGISGNYTIENEQVRAEIKLPVFTVKLTNKASSKSYQTGWAQFAIAKSVNQINAQTINVMSEMPDASKSPVSVELKLEGKALKMTISGDSSMALNSDIQFPGTIPSQTNDFLIVPRGTGIILPVSSANPFGNFAPYNWKSTMPFVGVTNLKDGYMVVANDQWDTEFQFEKPTGQNLYSFKLYHKPAKSALKYDRTSYLIVVDNGYNEMCQWYREHAEKLGYVKTFSQKKAENPNIDKLIGAVDFWPISMNIKPEFLDTVKLMGIDKAMWNLTGSWGKPNFSTLINAINSHGYLSNRYDIFTDVWPKDHPEWTWIRSEGYPEDVIVDSNGELKKGWLAYPNNQPFQGYYTCSDTHLAYAKKYVPEDLKTNRYNSRFIDVELASSLVECFSTVHPLTRKQDAEARTQLLDYIKNDLNLVTGAEEAYDFAFRNVDYGEGTMTIVPATNAGYDWSQPLEPTDQAYAEQNINPKMRIPLHGLVYHDVHIPTWYTGDGASKVPAYWDDKNLWNILYGTMPLYMPPSKQYWYANLEKFISGYHLMTAVTRNVGYAKMTSHRFLSNDHQLQETTFENGWKVVANFDVLPHVWENRTLAAKGFYASGEGTDEAGKLIINDKPIGWALTGNRLFFNAFGTESSLKGLRTTQSVFCEKFADYLLVSFIGKQNYLDMNTAELPFEVAEITKVTEYFSGTALTLTTMTDGWKRLNRPAGKSYFKVYYKPKITGISIRPSGSGTKIFPNPAQSELILEQDETSGNVFFSICNLGGQEVIKQAVFNQKTTINIGILVSGMYFLKLVRDGSNEVIKFIKE